MRSFERSSSPDFLTTHWQQWGKDWKQRKEENSRAKFGWRQINSEQVNHLLLKQLMPLTQSHCSFCDAFPVSPPGEDTIEHFKPKSSYPLQAYEWENLYYCCTFCQKKSDQYDERLLRPDAPDYDCARYFIFGYLDGSMKPNPKASAADQKRAEITIKLYSLDKSHQRLRKLELRKWAKAKEVPIDEWAYRDYLENAVHI